MQSNELKAIRLQASELHVKIMALQDRLASSKCDREDQEQERDLQLQKDLLRDAVRSTAFAIACLEELQKPSRETIALSRTASPVIHSESRKLSF